MQLKLIQKNVIQKAAAATSDLIVNRIAGLRKSHEVHRRLIQKKLQMNMIMMMMNCCMVWLNDERRLALFPARTIVRDPHHRKLRHVVSRIKYLTKKYLKNNVYLPKRERKLLMI